MSKFEAKNSTWPCCGNCIHLDRSFVFTTYPAQYACKLFKGYVLASRETCLEDEGAEKKDDTTRLIPRDWALKQIAKEQNEPSLADRVANLENWRTEVQEALFELRNKVEALEKAVAQINDTIQICAINETRNYEDLRKRVEALEKCSKILALASKAWTVSLLRPLEDIELDSLMPKEPESSPSNPRLDEAKEDEKVKEAHKPEERNEDKGHAQTEENEYYLLKRTNPFRCPKCDRRFKVASTIWGFVEHCPFCGEKPTRETE